MYGQEEGVLAQKTISPQGNGYFLCSYFQPQLLALTKVPSRSQADIRSH